MSRLQLIQEHLNRWMLAYVSVAIAAGLGVGDAAAGWTKANTLAIGGLTTGAVFLIIYPMMVNVRFEALRRAGRNLRGIGIALAFNFVWAPIVGWILATVFLSDPLLSLGFLLVMVVPCSSMAIGYTGLAKGDLELATVVVAVSFLLAIIAVPLWMTLFASRYAVAVPIGDLINSILTVLVAPMVLGHATRRGLLRWLGNARFAAIAPLFPALSLLGMYSIVFLIFLGKATLIIDRWQTVAILLIPNAIFIALSLVVLTWLDHRLGLGYEEHMAVAFTSTGKNNGTAIAIAATAFSPLVAIPAATMPIFQILLMVLYLRAAPRLRARFQPAGATAEAGAVPRPA
ncbi:MAG: arsenic resistance protein [Candidatus Limnocylindrales bacterium]